MGNERVDMMTILKGILRKSYMRVWTGFIRLRIRASGGILFAW